MLRWAKCSGFCSNFRILLSDAGSLEQNKTKQNNNRTTNPSKTDLIVSYEPYALH
jgi:hypothetical protein